MNAVRLPALLVRLPHAFVDARGSAQGEAVLLTSAAKLLGQAATQDRPRHPAAGLPGRTQHQQRGPTLRRALKPAIKPARVCGWYKQKGRDLIAYKQDMELMHAAWRTCDDE